MCQFETPLFIIYSSTSVIVLSLIVALSILAKGIRRSLNRNAFYFILVIALWTMGNLAQWLTRDAHTSYLLFRLSNLIDFFFLFFLYFAYALVGIKLGWKKKIIFASPLVVVVFLATGNYGLGNVGAMTCDNRAGLLVFPSLFTDLAYSVWASVVLMKKYRQPLTYYKTKLQIRVLVFAIISFMLWNIIYGIMDSLKMAARWNIDASIYFITGNLFFIILMIFNMIEYDLFDFKVAPRKWLVFAVLSVVFGGMLLLSLTPMAYFVLLTSYVAVIWLFWGK